MKAEPSAETPVQRLVGYQLRRAHTLFALHWQLACRDDQPRVTPMQGGMLLLIAREPGMSQAALARLMAVEGPTLLQALNRLEANGLVRRMPRADDRRSHALHLTPLGRRAVTAVRRFVPAREQALLADLSEPERVLFLDMLQRVVQRGQAVTEAMLARPAPRRRIAARSITPSADTELSP